MPMLEEDTAAVIDGYNFQRPSRTFALRVLISSLGRIPAMDAWRQAAANADVSDHSDEFDDLVLIFSNLASQSGVVGVIGRSLSVRAATYRALFQRTRQI